MSYSFVFSEKLRAIMFVLFILDKNDMLQTRYDEELVFTQCKTKEKVMALEVNDNGQCKTILIKDYYDRKIYSKILVNILSNLENICLLSNNIGLIQSTHRLFNKENKVYFCTV